MKKGERDEESIGLAKGTSIFSLLFNILLYFNSFIIKY